MAVEEEEEEEAAPLEEVGCSVADRVNVEAGNDAEGRAIGSLLREEPRCVRRAGSTAGNQSSTNWQLPARRDSGIVTVSKPRKAT